MRKLIYLVFSVATAMIGYTMHRSTLWAIFDFVFTPVAWVKWIICHDITLNVIKQTFSWFFT